MKRILFFIAIMFCVGIVSAQDVIVLRSGELIEDVTIISIGEDDISYSKNGNTLTTPRNTAEAVLYADGRYEEIKAYKPVSTEESTEQVTPQNQDEESEAKRLAKEQKAREAEERRKAQELALEQKRYEAEEKKRAQEAAKAAALEQARMEKEQALLAEQMALQDGKIHRIKANSWFYIDRYYTKTDIKSLVLTTCPDAQQYYNNAKKWVIGGWSGVGASVAMIITGGVLMGIGIAELNTTYYDSYGDRIYGDDGGKTVAGAMLIGFGSGGTATSLIIASIGHARMNNAYKVFNKSCADNQEPPITLNIGSISSNGIGISLNF